MTAGIRHPEELSLCRPLEASHLKHNYKEGAHANGQQRRPPPDTNTFIAASGAGGGSLDAGGAPLLCAPAPGTYPPRSQSATPISSPVSKCSYYSGLPVPSVD